MTAEQWFYRIDGRSHGPFNAIQFDKLIRGKTVTPTTDVSMDGKSWRPFRDILAGIMDEASSPPSAAKTQSPQSTGEWMMAQTLLHDTALYPPTPKAENDEKKSEE